MVRVRRAAWARSDGEPFLAMVLPVRSQGSQAAWEVAPIVIAQVNQQMPRVHGDGFVPLMEVDAWCRVDEPLPLHTNGKLGDTEKRIGKFVATLIEDGSCLQAGIGGIPDAVLAELCDDRRIGNPKVKANHGRAQRAQHCQLVVIFAERCIYFR